MTAELVVLEGDEKVSGKVLAPTKGSTCDSVLSLRLLELPVEDKLGIDSGCEEGEGDTDVAALKEEAMNELFDGSFAPFAAIPF